MTCSGLHRQAALCGAGSGAQCCPARTDVERLHRHRSISVLLGCGRLVHTYQASMLSHCLLLLQVPRHLSTAPFDSGGQTGRLRTVTALQVSGTLLCRVSCCRLRESKSLPSYRRMYLGDKQGKSIRGGMHGRQLCHLLCHADVVLLPTSAAVHMRFVHQMQGSLGAKARFLQTSTASCISGHK